MNCLKYLVLFLILNANVHAYYKGPMNDRIFDAFSKSKFELIEDDPSPLEQETGCEFNPHVFLTRDEDGTPIIANHLVSGTKVTPGRYAIPQVTCYGDENPNGELRCDFDLVMIEPGRFVYFMGLSPRMNVSTSDNNATIRADFSAPGFRRGIYNLNKVPLSNP